MGNVITETYLTLSLNISSTEPACTYTFPYVYLTLFNPAYYKILGIHVMSTDLRNIKLPHIRLCYLRCYCREQCILTKF